MTYVYHTCMSIKSSISVKREPSSAKRAVYCTDLTQLTLERNYDIQICQKRAPYLSKKSPIFVKRAVFRAELKQLTLERNDDIYVCFKRAPWAVKRAVFRADLMELTLLGNYDMLACQKSHIFCQKSRILRRSCAADFGEKLWCSCISCIDIHDIQLQHNYISFVKRAVDCVKRAVDCTDVTRLTFQTRDHMHVTKGSDSVKKPADTHVQKRWIFCQKSRRLPDLRLLFWRDLMIHKYVKRAPSSAKRAVYCTDLTQLTLVRIFDMHVCQKSPRFCQQSRRYTSSKKKIVKRAVYCSNLTLLWACCFRV